MGGDLLRGDGIRLPMGHGWMLSRSRALSFDGGVILPATRIWVWRDRARFSRVVRRVLHLLLETKQCHRRAGICRVTRPVGVARLACGTPLWRIP